MSDLEPHKLKVTELRDELKKRGLDTKGKKEQLVKRLMQALGIDDQGAEAGADESQANVDESDVSHLGDASQLCESTAEAGDASAAEEQADAPAASGLSSMGVHTSPGAAEPSPVNGGDTSCVTLPLAGDGDAKNSLHETSTKECNATELAAQTAAESEENAEQLLPLETAPAAAGTCEPLSTAPLEPEPAAEPGEIIPETEIGTADPDVAHADSNTKSSSEPTYASAESMPLADNSSASINSQLASVEDAVAEVADEGKLQLPVLQMEQECLVAPNEEAPAASEEPSAEWGISASHASSHSMEHDDGAMPTASEASGSCLNDVTDAPAEASNDHPVTDKVSEHVLHNGDSKEPARERSRSPRGRSHSPTPLQQVERKSPLHRDVAAEDEPWAQSTDVQLDHYNSDLNLIIKDSCTAVPLCQAGFAYMWAGARATYGVMCGKTAFEFKVTDEPHVDLPDDEKNSHVARVGWSTDSASTQLGEDSLSWGYGGTGKASHGNSFKDYGRPFGKGDVITAYLDMDSSHVRMSFSKNGNDLGVAYEIDIGALDGQALFPHVLSKNCEFTVNFGEKEAAFPLREGFVFIGSLPVEQRVRGQRPPSKRGDAEVIMLIGLPGSGKTYWAAKHCEANPEKRFNVLGTNAIIDKMRVMGLHRKLNYSGRWDVLFDKSNQCLAKLIDLAARKCRNYIIDQTNVYGTAQKRKMKPFEGYIRKAVVIVPSNDEFKKRIAKRVKEEGKEVPEDAVLEMKANFSIPTAGEVFDSVAFPELSEAESRELVVQYVKEGQVKFPPGVRRFRDDRRSDQHTGNQYGHDRGYPGPRSTHRNDRPAHGGSYRGGSGNSDYVGGRYEERGQRQDRGYYPIPAATSGNRGYSSNNQGTNYGRGGSGPNAAGYSKPYSASAPSAPSTQWSAAPAPTRAPPAGWGSATQQPAAGSWGAGWTGSQPQQQPPPWSSGYGGSAPAYRSQSNSYTSPAGGYASQTGSYASQPGSYGSQAGSYGGSSSGAAGYGGYGSQASGYAAQPGSYGGSPATGYASQANSYSGQPSDYGSSAGWGYGQTGSYAAWPAQSQPATQSYGSHTSGGGQQWSYGTSQQQQTPAQSASGYSGLQWQQSAYGNWSQRR